MGIECRAHGEEMCNQSFDVEACGTESTLRIEQRVDYISKMDFHEVGCGGMD